MRYFKNPETGVLHAYDVDGHQDKLIQAAIDAKWEETSRPIDHGAIAIPEALVKISELESTVTPRRLREAILGADGGWLHALDQQIAAMRADLKQA
jgi:hypothetical protein